MKVNLLQRLAYLVTLAPVVVSGALSGGELRGCRKLNTDSDWPAFEVWGAEIPGVTLQNNTDIHGSLPDYRLRAKSVGHVQAAGRFASKHNIRLSVITTGHDQLGRSDAGSGLVIDMSLMNRVNVLESFTPTSEGAASPDHTIHAPNIITPNEDIQPAVTFQPGVTGLALNYAVAPSNLFTVSGAAGMAPLPPPSVTSFTR